MNCKNCGREIGKLLMCNFCGFIIKKEPKITNTNNYCSTTCGTFTNSNYLGQQVYSGGISNLYTYGVISAETKQDEKKDSVKTNAVDDAISGLDFARNVSIALGGTNSSVYNLLGVQSGTVKDEKPMNDNEKNQNLERSIGIAMAIKKMGYDCKPDYNNLLGIEKEDKKKD